MHWSKEASSFGFALPIWGIGIGGNHETDRHFRADGRHVRRLDGERSGFNLLLLAGECIAAVSTVVLAEEFVEWRSRPSATKSSLEQRSI
jgi:hypothetical protein